MSQRRVLDVGQCGFDHERISHFLNASFDVEIVQAHSHDEAIKLAGESKFDLILINRLLDADHAPGIEIIKELKSTDATANVPVMIVSNFQDAQDEAVGHGAEVGFGKAALDAPETMERFTKYLAG